MWYSSQNGYKVNEAAKTPWTFLSKILVYQVKYQNAKKYITA